MTRLAVTPLHTDDFQSHVAEAEGDITLTLEGVADLRVWRGLGDLLGEIHDAALAVSARRVVVDVRSLEFMNSSCFKSIVTWLTAIMELEPPRQYRVHFRSSPERLWQRRSLHALRSFALMVVTIEP